MRTRILAALLILGMAGTAEATPVINVLSQNYWAWGGYVGGPYDEQESSIHGVVAKQGNAVATADGLAGQAGFLYSSSDLLSPPLGVTEAAATMEFDVSESFVFSLHTTGAMNTSGTVRITLHNLTDDILMLSRHVIPSKPLDIFDSIELEVLKQYRLRSYASITGAGDSGRVRVDYGAQSVPESSALLLLGFGLAALFTVGSRQSA